MTVVVWDGHTLAADRRGLCGGAHYAVTKIFDVGFALVGISGHLAHGREILRWLGKTEPGEFPEGTADDDHATLLVVRRDGRIERYENRAEPIVVEAPTHAIGSGREFALMALHMGADARRAVELTCELSAECGNGVDVLTFDG